jgi:MFS family permease
MVLANGRAILSTVYAQHERGRALGVASMAFHLGYISGPSVAGVLIDAVGWRWIFFLNLPVALAAAFMAWKVLPETAIQRERRHSLDLMGMVTLFSMAVTLILGLQQIAKSGFTWMLRSPVCCSIDQVMVRRFYVQSATAIRQTIRKP